MASENKFKEIPEEQPLEEAEAMNQPGDAEQQAASSPKKEEGKPRKTGRAKNFFKLISVFDVVDKNRIVHAMPFILFLTVIAMFYITNSFYAERTIRDIDRTKREIKEKRAEFISTKSKLMLSSMQSEVAQHASAAAFEIKESTVPPKKIVISPSKEK